ncbi:hypothetical protein LCM17_02005 [Cereibacter sphaeroides]|nr:hypothetical protein [Cereibacter sphaeroides]
MHPVDEFAALKSEIRRLEARAAALRIDFLEGGPAARSGLRSERHELMVREEFRRTLVPDRLPIRILDDPHFWDTRVAAVVTIRRLTPEPVTRSRRLQRGRAVPNWQADLPGLSEADDDDIVLVE